MPYIVMTSSARVRGKARRYGRYINVAVAEVDAGEDGAPVRPLMISARARGLRRVVVHYGSQSVGTTARCQSETALASARALAAHLNRIDEVATRPITADEIEAQENVELQRELIEAFGGLDAYLGAVEARKVHSDGHGRLIERRTAAGMIRAVAVVCPSTGRDYVLRVPPETQTAHEAVAWTFGLAAADYAPTLQS